MNCDLIIEDLQAFLDNELQATRRSEVQTHLQICGDCSQMISDLKDLSSLMKSCDIPTPNLPTGQELLAKANSQSIRNQNNPFTNFLFSVYDFLFKYKAPVLATVTAATLIVVAINISGVKEGKITFYSEQEKSRVSSAQDRSLNEDLAKTAPNVGPAAEAPAIANNVESKENVANAKAPATLEPLAPLAKPQIAASNETTAQGAVEGTGLDADSLSGGVVGGVLSSSTRDNVAPPPPPNDAPKKSSDSQKEEKLSERKEQDELAKNNFADKKALAEQEAKNSPNNSSEVVEVISKDDSKEKNLDPTQSTQLKVELPREKSGKSDSLGGRANSKLGMPAPASVAQPRRAIEAPAKPTINEPIEETRQKAKYAEVTILAKDLQSAKTQITQIAEAQKGNVTVAMKGNEVTSIAIRIPNSKLEDTLIAVRKVGKVVKENTKQTVLVDELAKQRKDAEKTKSKRSGEKAEQDKEEPSFSIINIIFVK